MLQPALLVQALTLRAVPVATGVVSDLLRPALFTLVHMPAQSSGTADLNGPHGPQLRPRQPVLLPILLAVETEDVGHLQLGGRRHDAELSPWSFAVRVGACPAD